jgi:hypothetical protein
MRFLWRLFPVIEGFGPPVNHWFLVVMMTWHAEFVIFFIFSIYFNSTYIKKSKHKKTTKRTKWKNIFNFFFCHTLLFYNMLFLKKVKLKRNKIEYQSEKIWFFKFFFALFYFQHGFLFIKNISKTTIYFTILQNYYKKKIRLNEYYHFIYFLKRKII